MKRNETIKQGLNDKELLVSNSIMEVKSINAAISQPERYIAKFPYSWTIKAQFHNAAQGSPHQ